MTCIYGQVEIYGHVIKQGQPARDVYSTYTHAYLTINGVEYPEPEKSEKEIRREIRALLKPHMRLGKASASYVKANDFKCLLYSVHCTLFKSSRGAGLTC